MKSLTVALGLSLALLATHAYGQLALRSPAQPKQARLKQADYHETSPASSHVKRVGCDACSDNSVPDCGCESLFPDCGCESYTPDCGCESARGCGRFTPDCGCESYTPDCGCESARGCGRFTPDCGCESYTPDCGCESSVVGGSGCHGCAGDAGGLFGTGGGLGLSGCKASLSNNPCGCAIGNPHCVPYPRCFLFKSPCLSTPCGMDPCCTTIFSEMWCDIKSWMSTRPCRPSAACCGSCPSRPFGFGNCSPGILSGMTPGCGCDGCGDGGTCFQDILQPRCTGDCCARPAPLRTMATSLFGRVSCLGGGGGCAEPVMCDGCSGAVADGFADGEYYEPYESADGGHVVQPAPSYGSEYYGTSSSANATRKPRGTSSRYFTVTRPGSNQTEYVTAQEYAMIEAGRADRAERVARELKAKDQSLSVEEGDTPQVSRSPGLKDQTRRALRSGVEKAAFHSAKRVTRRSQPRSTNRDSRDDYIKFDR